jgi:hypothetical protein
LGGISAPFVVISLRSRVREFLVQLNDVNDHGPCSSYVLVVVIVIGDELETRRLDTRTT